MVSSLVKKYTVSISEYRHHNIATWLLRHKIIFCTGLSCTREFMNNTSNHHNDPFGQIHCPVVGISGFFLIEQTSIIMLETTFFKYKISCLSNAISHEPIESRLWYLWVAIGLATQKLKTGAHFPHKSRHPNKHKKVYIFHTHTYIHTQYVTHSYTWYMFIIVESCK